MKRYHLLLTLLLSSSLGILLIANKPTHLESSLLHTQSTPPNATPDSRSTSNLDTLQQTPIDFELPVDASQYTIHSSTIQKNEFLSDILLGCNVPYSAIDALNKQSKDITSIKQIRAGNPYTAFCNANNEADYFVYENSLTNYTVFDLTDKEHIHVYECQKDITYKTLTAAGVITNSLYEALQDANASSELATYIADIFAWTIDFFKIQKNDKFKIIYTQKYVNDQPVGIGQIQAAYFETSGEGNYAIAFEQDGEPSFFTETGEAVRKAFLKAPLKYSRISSRYNKRRRHPVSGVVKGHFGTDYAAPTGTPIYSVGNGTIIEKARKGGNGNYIKIRHNTTYTTQYLHMSRFAKGMAVGKRVQQGDVIGYVGSTGLATGPHLCYRFWKNGVQVDPFKEKFPSADPVKKQYKNEYEVHKNNIIEQLQQISYPEITAPSTPIEEEDDEEQNIISALLP